MILLLYKILIVNFNIIKLKLFIIHLTYNKSIALVTDDEIIYLLRSKRLIKNKSIFNIYDMEYIFYILFKLYS